MGKPSPPTPPNPIATAAAQTGTNVSTGVANAFLNNTNQNTPQGNLNYDVTGSYGWTDPSTGASYSIPRFTATQTLAQPGSPYYNAQQANIGAQTNQAQIGQTLSGNLLGQANSGQLNVDPNADPYAAGNPNSLNVGNPISQFELPYGQQQTSLAPTGQQQTQFDATGMPVTNALAPTGSQQLNVGPNDFSADRNTVQQSLMSRLQPSLDQSRSRLEQQLADQGIRYGSEAYNNAMLNLNQQQTDAQFAAIGQAGQEQQRMQQEAIAQGQFYNQAQQTNYQQALQSGQFANSAEAQAFAEAQARGQFANTAQSQQFQQGLQTGQFANNAQQNQFQQSALAAQFKNSALAQQQQQAQASYNAANTTRAQWLSEQYDKANQGINQISSLISGSQVSKPGFLPQSSNSIANTDVAGLINTNFSQSLASYNAQNTQFQQMMGGVLGGLAGVLSDERVKDVGDKVGTIFAANDDNEPKPLPVYEFSYKADPASTQHVGPMAQDVEKIDPSAVKTVGGVKYIDKTRMGSILRPHVLKKAA